MCFFGHLYKIICFSFSLLFFSCWIILYQAFNRYSCAIESSSAWNSVILGWWTTPAREILRFLSGGLLPRVGSCDSWAMDRSRAWDPAILGRWTVPTRGILWFLSDGTLQRVEFYDSWVVDCSSAQVSTFSEQWVLLHAYFQISWAVNYYIGNL